MSSEEKCPVAHGNGHSRQLARSNRYDPEIEHLTDVAAALDSVYGR